MPHIPLSFDSAPTWVKILPPRAQEIRGKRIPLFAPIVDWGLLGMELEGLVYPKVLLCVVVLYAANKVSTETTNQAHIDSGLHSFYEIWVPKLPMVVSMHLGMMGWILFMCSSGRLWSLFSLKTASSSHQLDRRFHPVALFVSCCFGC